MLETQIESRAVEILREQDGVESIKLNLMGNSGWPDREFLYQGHSFYMEFKRPGKTPTDLQNFRLNWLYTNGFACGWCDNVEDCVRRIREWKRLIHGDAFQKLLSRPTT
jgi:hypothetical protein